MKQNKMVALLAVAALSITSGFAQNQTEQPSPSRPNQWQQGGHWQHGGLGRIERGDQTIGSDIKDAQGNKLGTIKDVAADLESGRLLYVVATPNGGQGDVALTPRLFRPGQNDKEFVFNGDQNKIQSAPHFTDAQKQNPGDMNFVTQIYTAFNEPTWWTGNNPSATGRSNQGFGNVQLASDLMNAKVQSSSSQDMGNVKNLAFNLHSGRLLYVIFQPNNNFGQSGDLYAIPPMAFTRSSEKQTLTTGLDKNTLASAPHFTGDNWQQIENPSYAANVYRYYGKQAYWDTNLRPTGRDQFNNNDNNQNLNQQPQQNLNNTQSGNLNEGGAGDPVGDHFRFGQPIKKLIGAPLRGSNGQALGRLDEVLVDLTSGHILYGLVSLNGQNQQHALPPQMFGHGGLLKTDAQKIQGSPVVSTTNPAQSGTTAFVTQIYNYYGVQPWWGATATGNQNVPLGNVRRASHLVGLMVNDTSNQPLGKVSDVMIDMRDGRVPYVLLTTQGDQGNAFPLPPMALTQGSDRTHLTTGIDKNKLQSAPKVASNNYQQLTDPNFAANVYQFYGKQTYWTAPTSSQPGSRVYPQNQ